MNKVLGFHFSILEFDRAAAAEATGAQLNIHHSVTETICVFDVTLSV